MFVSPRVVAIGCLFHSKTLQEYVCFTQRCCSRMLVSLMDAAILVRYKCSAELWWWLFRLSMLWRRLLINDVWCRLNKNSMLRNVSNMPKLRVSKFWPLIGGTPLKMHLWLFAPHFLQTLSSTNCTLNLSALLSFHTSSRFRAYRRAPLSLPVLRNNALALSYIKWDHLE